VFHVVNRRNVSQFKGWITLPTAMVGAIPPPNRARDMIDHAGDSSFGLEVSSAGFEAIVTVHGEVDVSTAPELGAYLDEAINSGHRFVALNLARVEFIDGAGLRAIESRAERLLLSGGALSIRSPSAMVRRLIDIVGLADKVRVEPSVTRSVRPIFDTQLDLSALSPAAAPSGDLPMSVRRLGSIPPHDEVTSSALRLVVALSRATVGGADGVSVSLRRHGRLSTVAASDQTILDMDAGQYESGEGPCISASVDGRQFYSEFIEEETRWPAFTPTARSLGINAILSSPLRAGHTPVGALNIYSRTPSAFADMEQELASLFAEEASLLLTEAQADVTDAQLDDRLGQALRTRELISQAQGVIMAREGVSDDIAYTILRRDSLKRGQPLRQWAQEVLNSARDRRFEDAGLPGDER
jgi:anti-anti-sigma factor